MKMQSEFDKILSQKMTEQATTQATFSAGSSTSAQPDYSHLAFLMGQISRRQNTQTFAKKAYQAKETAQKNKSSANADQNTDAKTETKKESRRSTSSRPPRKSHNLTAAQVQAFQTLQLYVQTLPADFTELELKSTFRKLALKFHPDTTIYKNSEATFMEIKKAFDTLKDLFVKIEKSNKAA